MCWLDPRRQKPSERKSRPLSRSLFLNSRWVQLHRVGSQPFCQLRPPSPPRNISHRNGDGLLLSNQHDEARRIVANFAKLAGPLRKPR
jgi:hypothetical protein